MVPTSIHHYHSTLGLVWGLRQLYRTGIGPRGLLFLALDERSDVHLAVAKQVGDVAKLKVGHKLGLPWPFSGRYFYVDAVHPLMGKTAIVNGDRRIGTLATLVDVGTLISSFVKQSGDQSVFFGCTPHQPGSWWVRGDDAVPLHDRGYVDLVPSKRGFVARRTVDDGLYYLEREHAAAGNFDKWQRIFDSPFGNVLMLERRVLEGRLVLSCQRGLVELATENLPEVKELHRIDSSDGFAVVGRVTNGGFAVTRGSPTDWGLDDLGPATLVGSRGCSFKELGRLLDQLAQQDAEADEQPTVVRPPKK